MSSALSVLPTAVPFFSAPALCGGVVGIGDEGESEEAGGCVLLGSSPNTVSDFRPMGMSAKG